MNTYRIMPEGCRWSMIDASTPKIAYMIVCSLYNPRTRIAVQDAFTGETKIFTRIIDAAGNLVEVVEH